MINLAEIKKMSREEKIIMMEALWEELSRDGENIESPSWHMDTLKETEKKVEAGDERVADWDTAKKELRKRFE